MNFDHNNLVKNPILFFKFLSPIKLHRNGFVFKIFVWISVFWRKKLFENPILGCRDIKKKSSLIFFGTPLSMSVCSHLDMDSSEISLTHEFVARSSRREGPTDECYSILVGKYIILLLVIVTVHLVTWIYRITSSSWDPVFKHFKYQYLAFSCLYLQLDAWYSIDVTQDRLRLT